MTDLGEIEIHSSRKRLIALSVFALFCFMGGLLNISPFLGTQAQWSFWASIFVLICGLFLIWSLLAAVIALRQPQVAYRLNSAGLFIGNEHRPAFAWDQVMGATLSRGKRRSAIVVVLNDSENLNTDGLTPNWLASFLGRPTDRDLALTNMDTQLDLSTFLDLIGPYFHTYANQTLNEGI